MSDKRIKQNEWANRLAFIDGVLDITEEDKEELPVSEALKEIKKGVQKRRRPRRKQARRRPPIVWYTDTTSPTELAGSVAEKAKQKVSTRIQEFAAELLKKEAVSVAIMLYREAKKGLEAFSDEDLRNEGDPELAFEIIELFRNCLRFYEIGGRMQDALEVRSVLAILYANVVFPLTEEIEARVKLAEEIETLALQVIGSLEEHEIEIRDRMENLLKRPEIADLL